MAESKLANKEDDQSVGWPKIDLPIGSNQGMEEAKTTDA